MFIQIEDPSDLPRPPEEVQIRAIDIDPYPDGQRLRVRIELTPFVESPDLSICVLNPEGREVAALSIVGAHQQTLSVTIHLREPSPKDSYTLDATLEYEDLGQIHQFSKTFGIVSESGNEQA